MADQGSYGEGKGKEGSREKPKWLPHAASREGGIVKPKWLP